MIGWYVHAHGSGHLQRLRCVSRHLTTPVTVLSSLPQPADLDLPWVQLDDDLVGDPVDPTAGGTLHWAPLHSDGLRRRSAAIAAWVEQARPSLVVVDVSVEVAVLVRSTGVPVVVAAMRGDRSDRAHTTAYDLADALLAPWPAALPEASWPTSWSEKAWHVGGLSRYDERPASSPPGDRRVAVLWGSGGSEVSAADVAAAAAATPGWTWDVAGLPGSPWVGDPWDLLQAADVVVTHAGQNALAEVAAARRPAVVLPQERPHDEQRANGRALAHGGLAVVRDAWPAPHEWPALLETAAGQDGEAWRAWSDGHGAARAAGLLDDAVARHEELQCAPR